MFWRGSVGSGALTVRCGRRGWPTAQAARLAVFRWLGFYNHRRRHSTIGYLAPVVFEQRSTTLAIAA